jgi:hypothetical protein
LLSAEAAKHWTNTKLFKFGTLPKHGERRHFQSVSRKKVPNARGPSPTCIFAVTASVSVLIAQTSFENQLTT